MRPKSHQTLAASALDNSEGWEGMEGMEGMEGVKCLGASELEVHRCLGGEWALGRDWVADEVPVALVFNGVTLAVMMATPLDLEDFALGFGLTEGLLARAQELYTVQPQKVAHGIELHLEVAAACEWRLKERRRTLAGRTGCGLCGSVSLDQVRQDLKPVKGESFDVQSVLKAQAQLQQWQRLQQLTGATHAAAWAHWSGELVSVREDVGRHNALDKLIGYLVHTKTDPASGFVCITSRASFEMVQKTLVFGASLLSAISAPTALAVELASAHHLALAGFVRDDKLVAYSEASRFTLSAPMESHPPEKSLSHAH